MNNSVFLEVYSTPEDLNTGFLRLPIESYITFCIYKLCDPKEVTLYFLTVERNGSNEICMQLKERFSFIDKKDVPWAVSLCLYPIVSHEDTIVCGLCAVARHICTYRSTTPTQYEYDEGYLGFRKCCLQAPNEVSIWTKFCEVDLLETTKNLLIAECLPEIPQNIVRFENHLSKPVRIHNFYKIAREFKKQNNVKEESSDKTEETNKNSRNENRVVKNRKWKSNKKEVISNSDLNLDHQFAEGPFLTLADIILLPLYHILIQKLGNDFFQSVLPLTHKWYNRTIQLEAIKPLKGLVETASFKQLTIESIKLPETENVSLYKCDPKRHNPKKRLFTKEGDIENALSNVVDDMELNVLDNELDFGLIKWKNVPDGANPTAGHLPDERMARKTQQLENLAIAVLDIASDGDVIVDFCSGSGHLGILLAHFLPKCTIILLENKEQSLLRARNRVHDMGLKNVFFYQCNLDFFVGKFDIGVALHACGVATDLVLDKCLKANAKFVLCPCCYGSLHATNRLVYPRSNKFADVPIDQYLCMGHAADQTHKDHPLAVRGARCMAVIDSDRGHLAKELGYKVTLSRLKPLTCTPKNNLLIGVPT